MEYIQHKCASLITGGVIRFIGVLAILFCTVLNPSHAEAAQPLDEQIIMSPELNDGMGWSVAIDGLYAVAGAQYGTGNIANSGVAHVFSFDESTAQWQHTAVLQASDGAAGDLFGHAVAISGDTIMVSALYDADRGAKSGSVYVFERNTATGEWTEQAKLTAADGSQSDQFGWAMALQGGRAVISAWWDDVMVDGAEVTDAGSAYIFERHPITGAWLQRAKLTGSDTHVKQRFGVSVALYGERVALGAYWDSAMAEQAGSTYIYRRDASTSTWIEEAKLTPSDGVSGDNFGGDVAIGEGRIVIGALMATVAGKVNAGAAYIYEYTPAAGWTEAAKLVATEPQYLGRFGKGVALQGPLVSVGSLETISGKPSEGAIYLYAPDRASGTWGLISKIVPSDSGVNLKFGYPIATTEGYVFSGAGWAHDNGDATPRNILEEGRVYLYDIRTLSPSDSSVIRFQDVSINAGLDRISHKSFGGGAWGDLNGDGWPDLWSGNHATAPNLYINNGDGTFTDRVAELWSGDPAADTHGAAWADFDRDGDQDLVELVGAQRGFGAGSNHLFVNVDGVLKDQASAYGVDHPSARGRTPLWLDWNRDGTTDLLTTNFLRVGYPSALWTNQDSALYLDDPEGDFPGSPANDLFAELSDLNGDNVPEVIVLRNGGLRAFYDLNMQPVQDIGRLLPLPGSVISSGVIDVAVGDFNNDLLPDIYLAKSRVSGRNAVNMVARQLFLHAEAQSGDIRGVAFRCEGRVEFDLGIFARDYIFIGADGVNPISTSFILHSEDAGSAGLGLGVPGRETGVFIGMEGYDTWNIQVTSPESLGADVYAKCLDKVRGQVKTIGFTQDLNDREDYLVMQQADGSFIESAIPGISGASVAMGDFDNDMDLDVYVVRTAPANNLGNVLLLNDGQGRFVSAPEAYNAGGLLTGKGDGVAVADYDQDGFLDLFLTHGSSANERFTARHQLLRNRGNKNHWLEIDLHGSLSNPDGIGAKVIVSAGGVTQMREQNGGMHRLTQNHQRLHFGLGGKRKADSVTIRWPSGASQTYTDVAADQIFAIRE